jgi:hypothetical protein
MKLVDWILASLLVLWLIFLIAAIYIGIHAQAWGLVIVCSVFLPVNSIQLGQLIASTRP